MTPDSEGLHEIANTTDRDRKADIVFIHGLGGAAHKTWRYGKEGKTGHFFWPEDLGKALPDCGIWTVGYPAGFTALGKPGMIIEKRAGNLSQKLANAGLGARLLLFITHSMGGLVVKSLIVGSQTLADPDRKRIVSVIRGIVFCATPHRGSAFADAAGVLGAFFGGSQDHVDEMRANAEPLDILHDQFIEWHRNHLIPVDSYAENIGLFRTRRWWRPLPLGLVVPRASANPGIAGHTVRDVDDDHLTIVKPRDRKHDVYAGVLRFVRDALTAAAPEQTTVTPPVVPKVHRERIEEATTKSRAFQADISRIVKYAPADLIGREAETKLLTDAWEQAVGGEPKRLHVLTFVALGGEGKTSLVAKWAADLAHRDWPGCDTAFAWSFYSQGTRDQTAASSDVFLKEALGFFGDPAMAGSAQGAFDKGRRLAQLVGERRALLILDGVEPLQYAPTSPTPGELKDLGFAALLKGLAATSLGLCIVTTRYAIADLRAFAQTTAPMQELKRLSTAAGVQLLRTIGVRTGSQAEFEKLVEDVDGHALTLQILGQFLVRAFHGDIRRRDRVKFEKADERIQGGHAFRAMAAYAKWLEEGSEEARREVAVLKLLGLFDRPATADCVAALLKAPAIPGLTEPLMELAEDDWEFSLSTLRDAKLLTVNREEGSGVLLTLDAHPLLREYFARQLRREQPDAWRTAHRRLYEHLCATKDKPNPTLEDLQPLYQAVAHGCQAGMQQEACDAVYHDRIQRRREAYSTKKLGAFGSDLGAIACFFEQPWSRVSPALTEAGQAWLLNEAATRLRALGRLTESLEPMRAGLEHFVAQEEWKSAAGIASNLSELELMLGEVAGAVGDAEQSLIYADRSGDWGQRVTKRTTHAGALQQWGRRAEAEARFREAEEMQAEEQPDYPLLYSLQGFQYCDLLLTEAERAAWRASGGPRPAEGGDGHSATLKAISERAAQTLEWAEQNNAALLTIALDHLTLGRAALYAAILEGSSLDPCRARLQHAVDGLRCAGTQDHLPRGLLTRAWLRFLEGKPTGPESAQSDLDEAWEIAERGPMKLHMADIHLHRARLFFREAEYPWGSPQADLAAARKLIEQCGYGRRKEELEDAEATVRNWPAPPNPQRRNKQA